MADKDIAITEVVLRERFRWATSSGAAFWTLAVMGWVAMALWNAVIPDLFIGARQIDYLHALGLLVLCRILFGGFRGGGHFGWHGRRHWAKWEAMTPEERDQLRQRGPWGKWRSGGPK